MKLPLIPLWCFIMKTNINLKLNRKHLFRSTNTSFHIIALHSTKIYFTSKHDPVTVHISHKTCILSNIYRDVISMRKEWLVADSLAAHVG